MAAIDIKQFVKDTNNRHPFYADTVKLFEQLNNHYTGTYDKELIETRRPSESDLIKAYRKKISTSITFAPFNKVISSLQKIRKSQDYVIKFDSDIPSIITEQESLENYTTLNFPKYTSLDNWIWNVCFAHHLVDSNGISLIIPTNIEKDDNEYYKPFPLLFRSDQILDYKEGQYYVLLSDEKHRFYSSGSFKNNGLVLYYVDTEGVYKYEQIDLNFNFKETPFIHGLGETPVVHLNGVVLKDIMGNKLCRSRLSPLLPRFREADREYSDLQAEVVQHIHSTYWAYDGRDCKKCKGTGEIPKKGAAPIKCDSCNGHGIIPFNPYENISVKPPAAGESSAPTPPAGYLQKQIDIAVLQDKRVHDHIYHGLAGINCEFLAVVPLLQSGVAKEVDRAENKNFTYSVCEDIIRITDEHFRITALYRYGGIITDEQELKSLLPTIPIPEKYDIIPSDYISSEMLRLKQGKANPLIIAATETEYVSKRFNTDPDLRDVVEACFTLDALSGRDEADLTIQLMNGGISKLKYTIHSNIKEYVEMAMDENADFLKLDRKDQKEIIKKYAEVDLKESSARERVRSMVDQNPDDATIQ